MMLLPAFFANAIKKNTLTLEKSVKQRNKKQKKSKEKYIKFPKKLSFFLVKILSLVQAFFWGRGVQYVLSLVLLLVLTK